MWEGVREERKGEGEREREGERSEKYNEILSEQNE
jgi:hypothetical protein